MPLQQIIIFLCFYDFIENTLRFFSLTEQAYFAITLKMGFQQAKMLERGLKKRGKCVLALWVKLFIRA